MSDILKNKDSELSPLAPDPFEYFSGVQREKSWWQRICLGLIFSHSALVLALVASALRPPQVIVKDRIMGAAPYLHQSGATPSITARDARYFFMQMIHLRYGWDSRTLHRDLKTYLGQCLQPQRARETSFFEARVGGTKTTELSRIQSLIRQELQNKVVFSPDLDQIECAAKEGVWHCMARIDIIESALDPGSQKGREARRTSRLISASLLQVRHTVATPSGLIVGLMKDFVESKKGET